MGGDIKAFDIAVLLVTLFAVTLFYARSRKKSSEFAAYPLPPGPKGLPIIGNLLDIPLENEWLTFANWGKRYGESFDKINQSAIYFDWFRSHLPHQYLWPADFHSEYI